MPFIQQQELVFLDKDSTEAEILAAGADAEVLFVDAITVVSAALMEHMPCLRLIHSEGVAFDRIDLSAARERGIYVCNNKGCNAGAVAEQTVLLILMLLRHALEGDEAVRAGRQMEMKERCMVEGITELSACKVGLVGFGDIARAAAERLVPFGCELYYYTKHRRLPEEEKKYHVTYLPLEELAEKSDIVSLHCAVTEETRNLVDAALLRRMKPTAYLINTARGDLVDNEALRQALLEGRIAGAGLDTLSPEPVPGGAPPDGAAAGGPAESGPGTPPGRHYRGILPSGPCPHVAKCGAFGCGRAAGQHRQRPVMLADGKKFCRR